MIPAAQTVGIDVPAARVRQASETARGAFLVAQLGIVWLLARVFHIENAAFYRQILPLALGGAVVNHVLPRAHRPAFFGLLGVAGVVWVFGVTAGAWLVGLGLALIGLCHLPIAFRWRVVMIALAGATLGAMRADWLPGPWPRVIWPIFGSMFMFRLAIYLYDLKHQRAAEPGLVLSYFFLLPNVVFPFFPVIDFHTYRRTYYDRPPFEIYEEGIAWIFRGLTHLVLYRVVYQYVALSPADVSSTAGIVRYLVGNYGLYLRVSGQFHLIVGLLHLFGFRLPETHRFFYLASSFSDLWRRINIYWKDFMQKMVYLPVFFGLKPHGETVGLIVATASVVGATWFLHSYQWFWLLGTWLFSATDALFWGMLGVVLIANTLGEQRRGRVRQLAARTPVAQAARAALQTAAMFAVMAVLWGVWTSPTFDDFRVLLRAATLRPVDLAVLAAPLALVATLAFLVRRAAFDAPAALAVRPAWRHPLVVSALPLAVAWCLGLSSIVSRLPLQVGEVVRDVRVAELNRYDAERLQRGYYEKLVGVNRYNGQLWEIYTHAERDRDWEGLGMLGGMARRSDPLESELLPLAATVFKGGVLRTNRWGMRDRDYEQTPPPATRRIAVLGQSYVMGSGVNDGEPFEAVVEDSLNREWSARTGLHYELLNFAVPRYSLAQQALIMENGRVAGFAPNVVLVVGHGSDLRGLSDYIWKEIQFGRGFTDPVAQWVREAEIDKRLSNLEVNRRLHPYEPRLARWALQRVAAAANRLHARPTYVLIPMPTDRFEPEDKSALLAAAQESGFVTIDMGDVYKGYDELALALKDVDRHPNTEGHRVIAKRLYAELTSRPALLAADVEQKAYH